MTKIIDFKKSIVKKGKKEKATDDEFYAEINQTKDLIPFTFDADTPEIEELSSVIAYTIAVRSAVRFMTISECMDEASIRKILSTIEEMPSREAVKMLQALFVADGMILESEDLDLIILIIDKLSSKSESSENLAVREVSIDVIDPSPYYPFRIEDDEDIENLSVSILIYGQITPAIVREKADGRYEMLVLI
ncbi:MAG: ParB N-terminal domain-containing protein [Mogibacterium sp.]|nr:ParB N-terminal domain-containing protein [Mogibacterium sp.]